MFTFEDLGKLDAGGVQTLLRAVDKSDLALALKGASDTLRQLFFTNMSERGGKLLTDHIIDSTSKLFPVDEWVTAEIEVRGHDEVIHRINGVEVLRYQHPQLDPGDKDAQKLLAAGAPLQLGFGHIALQAESQPIWFRNIRIRPL